MIVLILLTQPKFSQCKDNPGNMSRETLSRLWNFPTNLKIAFPILRDCAIDYYQSILSSTSTTNFAPTPARSRSIACVRARESDRERKRERERETLSGGDTHDENRLFQRRKSMADIPHIIFSLYVIIDLYTIFYSYENIRFFTALSSYFSSSSFFFSFSLLHLSPYSSYSIHI